jgi:hypothetical protein
LISSPESFDSNVSSSKFFGHQNEQFCIGSSELEKCGGGVLLEEWELMRLSVRELNQKLAVSPDQFLAEYSPLFRAKTDQLFVH